MKHKLSDVLTVVLFLAILAGFAAAFVLLPDKDISVLEGRALQTLPDPNAKRNEYKGLDYVVHGELARDFDEYFCDQFPLRKFFLTVKTRTEMSQLRSENNGVLYSSGRLAAYKFDAGGLDEKGGFVKSYFKGKTEFYDEALVRASMKSIKEVMGKTDIPFLVCLPPRVIDVYGPAMGYPGDGSDALNAIIGDCLPEEIYVDILPLYREISENGYYPDLYYRTDHHWTTVGAYYAYLEIIKGFGETPYEDFVFEPVCGDFTGTAWRNGNFFFLPGNAIHLARFEGDGEYKVELLESGLNVIKEYDSMYNLSYLEGSDKYGVFLHGKPPYMRITLEGADRSTLLVVKDSFAHCLIPFLARHFDLVIVDLDLDRGATDISAFIKQSNADMALIVYNLENVVTGNELMTVR